MSPSKEERSAVWDLLHTDMATGDIKLNRLITEDPLYRKEPFTKWQAWLDLILSACYEPGDMFVRGIKVKMKRGSVYKSAMELAERWKWSRGKVERFIAYLAEEKRIVLQKSKVISSMAIVGYDAYAIDDDGSQDAVLQKLMAQMSELKERVDASEQPILTPEEPKAETKKTPRKKSVNPLITKGREVFESKYSDLFDGAAYYWQAKDAAAMDSLTKKIIYARKQKNMPTEDDDVIKAFVVLLDSIVDPWVTKNFSVTNINSKYNEIVAQARAAVTSGKGNGTNQSTKEARANDAASIIARLAAQEGNDDSPVR